MEVTSKTKKSSTFDKDKIYPSEKEIQRQLGDTYNNSLNHLMKDKNTCKTIMPTYGLYNEELIFKTTNQEMVPTTLNDPYLDGKHHFTTDLYKRFNEEMFKNRNTMKILDAKNKEKDSGSK